MNTLILNSAHNKYPLGNDPWIPATVKAISKLSDSADTIVTSLDPMPWSFVAYLAGRYGLKCILIVPALAYGLFSHSDFRLLTPDSFFDSVLDDFNLDRSKVSPVYSEVSQNITHNRKKLWQFRDRLAVGMAQSIFPVSIRPGGRLSRLLDEVATGKKIRDDFRIPWSSGGYIPRYSFRGKTINPLPDGEWLVHWTRASQGPWPGEKSWRFFRDMLEKPGEYVRNAGATLARIVSELYLRASSWKLPEGERAVAFTSQPVDEALGLMRWRQRYVRYTFEPYGIAIRLSALADLGARPVSYSENSKLKIENSERADQSGTDRLYFHAPGDKTDWKLEKEWRIRSNLSLEPFDGKDILALVPDKKSGDDLLHASNRDIAVHIIFK